MATVASEAKKLAPVRLVTVTLQLASPSEPVQKIAKGVPVKRAACEVKACDRFWYDVTKLTDALGADVVW